MKFYVCGFIRVPYWLWRTLYFHAPAWVAGKPGEREDTAAGEEGHA